MTFRTVCTGCERELDDGYFPFCPDCGAMSDVEYDLDTVQLRDSPNPYVRFADLLPVADVSQFPVGARCTPTVHPERLAAAIGLPNLFVKDETGLPTRTTKDRMAAVALPYLHEHGVRGFATSSTGNSSTAYAAAIDRLPAMTMYVVTAAAFRDRVNLTDTAEQVVDIVARDATYVDASEIAGRLALTRGLTAEAGFFNPGRREGLKLAWLEAAEQVGQPIDWYVQAVSSAMGVYGVAKAARELQALGVAGRPPKLLCVQQASCAPMVAAWQAGRDHIAATDVVAQPQGIASAILRGDPSRAYPHVHRVVSETGGRFISVNEDAIRAARSQLADLGGFAVCFAAAAAFGGLVEAVRSGVIESSETVLVNLTGADRPLSGPSEATHWLDRTGDGWDLAPIP